MAHEIPYIDTMKDKKFVEMMLKPVWKLHSTSQTIVLYRGSIFILTVPKNWTNTLKAWSTSQYRITQVQTARWKTHVQTDFQKYLQKWWKSAFDKFHSNTRTVKRTYFLGMNFPIIPMITCPWVSYQSREIVAQTELIENDLQQDNIHQKSSP